MRNDDYDPEDPRYWLNDDDDEDHLYYGPDPDDDEDSSEEFDCGFIPGYGCQLAGTEECDWECPYSPRLHDHPDYPNVTLAPIANVIAAIPLTDLKSDHDQEASS